MKYSNTVVLVMDPKNDLVEPSGKLYPAVKPVLEKHKVVSNINTLIDHFRLKGSEIMFSPIVFSEGYTEISDEPFGVLVPVIQSGAMIKGSYGGEIYNGFNQLENDAVLERSSINAFEHTDLQTWLRKRNIETIIICGMLSDICVESTMRTAYDRGYEVFTVTDATATFGLEKYELTLENSFPLFSKAIKTKDAISL